MPRSKPRPAARGKPPGCGYRQSVSWTPVNLPPAGWYPDPGGQPAVRWWDGHGWTGHLTTSAGPAGAPLGSSGAATAPGTTIPARAAWYGLVGVIVGIVIAGLLQGLALLLFPGSDAASILMGEIGLWIGFGGTCVVVSRHFGTGSLAEDFGLRFRWVDLGYGPLAAMVTILVAGGLGAIFAGTRFAGSNTDILTNQKGNTVGVALVAVIAAVGAPFFEELFFRGLLFRALRTRLGFGAVVVQALLFGLAHFQGHLGQGNVSIVTVIAGVGFVLGCAAHLTGRLGTGIVAHGLFNLFVTLSIIGLLGVHL